MKFYVRLLIISAACSAFIAIPGIAIYVALLTFSLGIFLPSVTYYLLAMVPGVVLGARTGNLLLGFAFSGVCFAIAALLPVLPDLLKQKDFVVALENAKIASIFETPPRTIEIIRPERFSYRTGGISYPEKSCNLLCRHLIESGQVDWIRFQIEDEKGGNEIIFFQARKDEAECKVPSDNSIEMPCALVKQNNDVEAELVIEAKYGAGKSDRIPKSSNGEGFDGWLNYTATSNLANERKIVYSNLQLSLSSPALPFRLAAKIEPSMRSPGGIEVWKTSKKLNRLDYKTMLLELGYKIPSDLDVNLTDKRLSNKNEPSIDQTRALLSVLDLPVSGKFNRTQMEVVNEWVVRARHYKDWPHGRLDLVRRIYEDTRLGSAPYFIQVIAKDGVSPMIYPLALKQLKENQNSDQMKQAIGAFRLIDKSILQKNKSTIKYLLDTRPNDQFYRNLIFAGARAGIDPAPYINRFENNFLRSKILAYCFLEPVGNSKSLQVLRVVLSKPRSLRNGTQPDEATRQALRALARHGDMGTSTQIIEASTWSLKEQILGSLKNTSKDWRKNLERACRW